MTTCRMQARLCEWCAQLCLRRSFRCRRSRAVEQLTAQVFAATAIGNASVHSQLRLERDWRAEQQRALHECGDSPTSSALNCLCVSPSSLTELSAGKGVQCKGKPALQCSAHTRVPAGDVAAAAHTHTSSAHAPQQLAQKK